MRAPRGAAPAWDTSERCQQLGCYRVRSSCPPNGTLLMVEQYLSPKHEGLFVHCLPLCWLFVPAGLCVDTAHCAETLQGSHGKRSAGRSQ